jgi:hypothetical protein
LQELEAGAITVSKLDMRMRKWGLAIERVILQATGFGWAPELTHRLRMKQSNVFTCSSLDLKKYLSEETACNGKTSIYGPAIHRGCLELR